MSLTVYVPKAETELAKTVVTGSAILGIPYRGAKKVEVYFEGNVYGAGNLHRFIERCQSAAGRLNVRYPTVAKMNVFVSEVDPIGSFDDERGVLVLDALTGRQQLAEWLGYQHHWQIPAAELVK